VHTLLVSSPSERLVVFTLPDVSELPVVQQGLTAIPQALGLVTAISRATGQYNAVITATAASDGRIALADLAAQSAALARFATGGAAVPYGGTTIHLTTPGDNYQDFFLADGLHIGTVGQAFIANDFVSAIDTEFGARVAPLDPGQIIAFAKRAGRTSSIP
jgi:hypothetical protein